MKEQTAVDWIIEQLQAPCRGIPSHIIEQAKQMEKEQIKAAFNQGYRDGEINPINLTELDIANYANAEVYYNETFGG